MTKIIKIRLLIDSICRQGLNDSETVNLQQLKGQIGLLLEHLRHAGLLSIVSVDVSEPSRSESALLPTSGSVSQSRKAQHEDALDTTNILREGHVPEAVQGKASCPVLLLMVDQVKHKML
jgi:hypothetical protein